MLEDDSTRRAAGMGVSGTGIGKLGGVGREGGGGCRSAWQDKDMLVCFICGACVQDTKCGFEAMTSDRTASYRLKAEHFIHQHIMDSQASTDMCLLQLFARKSSGEQVALMLLEASHGTPFRDTQIVTSRGALPVNMHTCQH